MSHYWSLRCPQCDESAGSINRGDRVYPAIVKDWQYLKQIVELSRNLASDIAVDIDIYSNPDLLPFLEQHDGHPLEMVSEYHPEDPRSL